MGARGLCRPALGAPHSHQQPPHRVSNNTFSHPWPHTSPKSSRSQTSRPLRWSRARLGILVTPDSVVRRCRHPPSVHRDDLVVETCPAVCPLIKDAEWVPPIPQPAEPFHLQSNAPPLLQVE